MKWKPWAMIVFGIFSLFVFFGSTKELFSINLPSIDLKVIVILIFLFLIVGLILEREVIR